MPTTNRKKDTEKYRKYIDCIKPIILDLLDEVSFLTRRSLQVFIEENYGIWQNVSWNAIHELKNENKIRTAKYPPRSPRGIDSPMWVYKEDLRINDIKDQILKHMKIYREFMEISREMGKHAQNVIEKALNNAGFVLISKEDATRYFKGKTYPKGNKLDFIGYLDGVFYGIEIKNSIKYPDLEKVLPQKEVADFHGLQFLLISRRVGVRSYDIFRRKGLYIEFENLIFSPKYSSIAKKMREIFYYPLVCKDEPWRKITKKLEEVPKYHDKYFYEIGRI